MADALGAWLVEQLADAGRKKLTELVFGSEQERALRRAAAAAVWVTAEDMSPSDSEQVEQIAMVICEVFSDPVLDAPLAGPAMLLEGLQAGIARQLAVLDDAELTGTGQSSADVLGVPGTVLANRLTGHLVREIIVRGSGGGPLTPLADQFNHEWTRLQIGGMLAQLTEEVRGALARPGSVVTMAGWPLDEVTDPFVLEVHRPVQPENAPAGLPLLPPYLPREHDEALGQVVRAAADGHSGIAVLVGGSSTGKTRACWETLALLRGQDPSWRLWHPIDPSRSDAALRELAAVGPRTVVWLNEAQFYLGTADGQGEKVAAGLRALLRDPARGPVLVLATLWPRYWVSLTAPPPGRGDDRHPDARGLLDGHDIPVASVFTPAQMSQLARAADARMAPAARSAPDGEVTQFLAGAPELLARYRNAPPAAAALIAAAMDARRLGMGAGLPRAFLETAAPGYLTDTEWDALGEDWLEQALSYTALLCKGTRGPLTPIRRRPARPGRNFEDQPVSTATTGPLYRLADYLDQHGRAHRANQIPPAQFWGAAAAHAAPDDQAGLGEAAHARGLLRDAAQLGKNAATSGNTLAILSLGYPPPFLRADPRSAYWVAAHAPLDHPRIVDFLLGCLRETGADEQVAALASRVAAHAPLDGPGRVASLLDSLRRAGTDEQVAALLARDPAAHVTLDQPGRVASLLDSLRRAEADDQVAALLARDPAAHVTLDQPEAVANLLDSLRWADADEQAAALASRAAAHAPLDDPHGVFLLLDSLRRAVARLASHSAHALGDSEAVASLLARLRWADADEQAAALASRAAAHAALEHPRIVVRLLGSLREADADKQAAALASGIAAHAALDDPEAVASLLDSLRRAGADKQAAALLARDPAAHAALDHPEAVAWLLDSLRRAGADKQAATLADRAATHAALEDPEAVAWLLAGLRRAGADKQAAALLARDPAAHAALDRPEAVAWLLDSLRRAGADKQAATLADRAAAHAALDHPHSVSLLLDSLREAAADEQAAD